MASNSGSNRKLRPVSMKESTAEYLMNLLNKDLFPNISSQRKEGYFEIKDYVNQPVRKEETVEIENSSLLAELNQEVEYDITEMQRKIDEGEVKNSEDDRPMKVLDPRFFHPSEELPNSLKELALYMNWKLRIPADCPCNIKVIAGKRRARTFCNEPDKSRVCRVIMHFGPEDVYRINDLLTNGKRSGDHNDYIMKSGCCLLMDKDEFKYRSLYVSGDTKITWPSIIPENLDIDKMGKEQMSRMNVSGRKLRGKLDRSRIEQMAQRRPGIRTRSYLRFTVIMDYDASHYIDNSHILNIARKADQADGSNMGGGIPTELPEHIRATLPPEIRGVVEGADGKLSSKVSDISRNVSRDLAHRPELRGSVHDISANFIEEATSSVVNNISINDLKDIEPDLDKLAERFGQNGRPANLEDPAIRRDIMRKERKARSRPRQYTNNASSSSLSLDTDLDLDISNKEK